MLYLSVACSGCSHHYLDLLAAGIERTPAGPQKAARTTFEHETVTQEMCERFSEPIEHSVYKTGEM
jgi:hypothetical protein